MRDLETSRMKSHGLCWAIAPQEKRSVSLQQLLCRYIPVLEEIKKAREKWLITGRRENEEQAYHHKRKEAHKVSRNKKKVYMKNVIESIEEDKKHTNTRKMYQTINQFKRGNQHKFNVIRNKKGELVMNKKEKAEIWKEHFDKLLNTGDSKD